MANWLQPALDYIPQWLEYQLRDTEQPGCVIAIVHKGRVVLERAFGYADIVRGEPLTPRHRFRVASHSKSFTAAGVMKLREEGRLGLDDRIGQHVEDLHPEIAAATIAQLLCHGAGIVRDGRDSGQWQDRRPFLSAAELRADLAAAPAIEANTRFKYSNHGYGLAGLLIEAVTGEPYPSWIKREWLERLLQPVVVTLDLHLVHHSISYDEANSNFGAVLSVWDRLFGTYARLPRAQQDRIIFGVRELPRRDCLRPSAMLLTPWRLSRALR